MQIIRGNRVKVEPKVHWVSIPVMSQLEYPIKYVILNLSIPKFINNIRITIVYIFSGFFAKQGKTEVLLDTMNVSVCTIQSSSVNTIRSNKETETESD